MRFAKIPVLILMLAAAYMIIEGGVKIVQRRIWVGNTLTAQGTVVGFGTQECVLPESLCPSARVPQVAFKTFDGHAAQFFSTHFAIWPHYQQGDAVTVFYNPEQPDDAAVDHPLALYSESVKEGQFGALLLCLSTALFFATARRVEETEDDLSADLSQRIHGMMNRQNPVRAWEEPEPVVTPKPPKRPMIALPPAAPAYVALLAPPRPA